MKFTILLALVASVAAYSKEDVASARIETCRGCALNRYPEIKQFVMEDAPKYSRVEVEFISGATPELLLLGERNNILERISLVGRSRKQCNELMEEKGFTKSGKKPDL